jgi:hypothetical protein
MLKELRTMQISNFLNFSTFWHKHAKQPGHSSTALGLEENELVAVCGMVNTEGPF